jgi:hypothetical protein
MYDAKSSLGVEVTFLALLAQLALTLVAEAVTPQDRPAIQKPTLNPIACDFRSDFSVVGLLSDRSATGWGGSWRRRQQ